ncbi:MAG: glycosyltransferase family 4 protein [Candidatus Aminicenantes bacterium]|nr:glycosyltransferase family 4 protein [Candidatus Aminicenantes bacterium]
MRIGFDLRPFLKEETGVGVYFRNLLRELAAVDRENEYFLFSSSWKDRFPRSKLPGFARQRFRDVRLPVRLVNALWYRFGRPTLDSFFGTRLDVTHSPVPLFLPTRGRKIVTVCDLFFLEHPELADAEARREFSRRAAAAVARADGVITISEYSRRVILERLGADETAVRAVPLGVDPGFFEPPSPEDLEGLRRRYALPETFVLFVGAFEPRKNLPRLVESWPGVLNRRPEAVLVLAGRAGGDFDNVKAAVRRLGLETSVLMPGYVPQMELKGFYRLATAFVLPSLCEGFGLPLLEAMAAGLPAAVSSVSALPEVAGDAALLFDPQDAASLTDAVLRLLEDDSLRRDLSSRGAQRARRFRWAETARQTLEFYRSVV